MRIWPLLLVSTLIGIGPAQLFSQSPALPCEAASDPVTGWGSMTSTQTLSGAFDNDIPWVTDVAGGIQTFGVANADTSVFFKLEVNEYTRSLLVQWNGGTATEVSAALFTLTSPECGGGTDYGESILETPNMDPLLQEDLEQSSSLFWDLCALSSGELEEMYLWLAVPNSGVGTFDLDVTQVVSPENDECEDPSDPDRAARDLGEISPGDQSGDCNPPPDWNPQTNEGACGALPSGSACLDGFEEEAAVWYSFTTDALVEQVTIEVEHSESDEVRLALFEMPSDCEYPVNVPPNQDPNEYCVGGITNGGVDSVWNVLVQQNTKYFVLVSTPKEDAGEFDICVKNCPPPDNDQLCDVAGNSDFHLEPGIDEDYQNEKPLILEGSTICANNFFVDDELSFEYFGCETGENPESSVFYKIEMDEAASELRIALNALTPQANFSMGLMTVGDACDPDRKYGQGIIQDSNGNPLLSCNAEAEEIVWNTCNIPSSIPDNIWLWVASERKQQGDFELEISQKLSPSNDDCGNPEDLGRQVADETVTSCFESSNLFACPENYDPFDLFAPYNADRDCYEQGIESDQAGVWLQFETTADADRFGIELNHSNNEDVTFVMFEPDPDCSNMDILYCEEDTDGDGSLSFDNYELEPDRTYWVLVHTDRGEEHEGDFEICINVKPEIPCDSLGPPFFDQTIVGCNLDDYETTCLEMPDAHPDGPFRWPGCLPNEMQNPTWITFVANDDALDIELDIADCRDREGIQIGLYELSCDVNFNPLNRDGNFPLPSSFVSSCPQYVSSGQIGTVNFQAPTSPGGVYGLVIDGFGGDQCRVVIEEIVRGGGAHELEDTELETPELVDANYEFGGDTICAGATGVEFAIEEGLEEACMFVWSKDGYGVPGSEMGLSERFDFPEPGTYEICVFAATLCDQTTRECIEVEVVEIEPFLTVDTICEGDDYIWTGPYGNELTPSPPINTDVPGSSTHTATAYNEFECYVPGELNLFVKNENEGDPTRLDTFACYDNASSGGFVYVCDILDQPGTFTQQCISPTTGCDTFFIIDLFIFGGPFQIDPVCLGNGDMGFFFDDPEMGGYTPWFQQLGKINADDSFDVAYSWTIEGTNDTLETDLNLTLSQDSIELLEEEGRLDLQMEIVIFYRDEVYCSSLETYSFVLEEHFPAILGFSGDTAYCRGREELELWAEVRHPTQPTPPGQPDSIGTTQWYLPDSFEFLDTTGADSDTILIAPPDTLEDGTLCFSVQTERCMFTDSLCIELEEGVPLEPELGPDVELCDSIYTLAPDTAVNGQWQLLEGPPSGDTLVFSDKTDPNANVTATGSGTYLLEWREGLEACPARDTLEITFLPPPFAVNLMDTCIGLDFIATVEFAGGEGAYSLHPNSEIGGSFDQNTFTSDTIEVDPDGNFGDTLYLVVADSSGCVSDSVPIRLLCGCETRAGSMDTDTLALCGPNTAFPQYLGGHLTEPDDTIMYVLHTAPGNQLGAILDTSLFTEGEFPFFSDINYGQIYYISAVFGDQAAQEYVDLNDPCLTVSAGQPVIWRQQPSADAGGDAEVCGLEATLNAEPSFASGEWVAVPDTGGVLLSDPTAPDAEITVSSPGTYTFRWEENNGNCSDQDEIELSFFEDLDFSVGYECNQEATEFRAYIVLSGGSGDYSEISNTGSFSGDTLITDWIPKGDEVQVILDDEAGCGPLEVTVTTECECLTAVGSLDTTGVLSACIDDCVDASGRYNPTGESLDGNDIATFILHNTYDTVPGSEVYDQDPDGTFCFSNLPATVSAGDTLYIAYAIGNEGPSGTVDLTDECLQLTYGVPVVFFGPADANAGDDRSICGLSATLEGNLPPDASGAWSYLEGPSGDVTILDPSQPNTEVEAQEYGAHRFVWSLNRLGCESSDTVELDFVDIPRIDSSSISFDCDPTNTYYTVTFEILGGDPSSLEVNGIQGTLNGNTFVSDSIPGGEAFTIELTDGNQCGTDLYEGSYDCDCTTRIGRLTGDTLHLCEDESIEGLVQYDPSGEVRDPNDGLRFVLLSENDDIVIESDALDFTFLPSEMQTGETYYIRAYLGSIIGGELRYDESCTQFDGRIPVSWWPYPEAMANPEATEITCSLTSLDIDGTGSEGDRLLYEWQTGDGQIDTDPRQAVVTVSSAGSYSLIVRDSLSGCSDTTVVEIEQSDDLPDARIASPGELNCDLEELTLDGSASSSGPNIAYEWTTADGTITGPADGPTVTVSAAGTYSLKVINTDNDCEARTTVEVEEHRDLPAAVIQPADTIGCELTEISLSGEGSEEGPDIEYLWTTAGGTIIGDAEQRDIDVSAPGVYELIVRNSTTGCADTARVEVLQKANELEVAFDLQSPDCAGTSSGSISVMVTAGEAPFTYRIPGFDENATGIFENVPSGNYTIRVEDAAGCTFEEDITIEDPPEISLELSETVVIGPGDSVVVDATFPAGAPPDTLIWDTDTVPYTCLSEECRSIVLQPNESMTVNATALQGANCRAVDQMEIILSERGEVYIPNVFSPNGDNVNDFFLPVTGRRVERVDAMQIYSRWGDLLFESRNFQPGDHTAAWDGTSDGQILPPGVYVYSVRVSYDDGTKEELQGTVTLLR